MGRQPWGTFVKAVKANYIIFRSVFCFESLYCLAFTAFTGPLDMGAFHGGRPMAGSTPVLNLVGHRRFGCNIGALGCGVMASHGMQ
jgi:hypothetical protein